MWQSFIAGYLSVEVYSKDAVISSSRVISNVCTVCVCTHVTASLFFYRIRQQLVCLWESYLHLFKFEVHKAVETCICSGPVISFLSSLFFNPRNDLDCHSLTVSVVIQQCSIVH